MESVLSFEEIYTKMNSAVLNMIYVCKRSANKKWSKYIRGPGPLSRVSLGKQSICPPFAYFPELGGERGGG